MSRKCGDCKACCEGWLLDESLDMYPGKPCKHCTNAGCAIYEERPVNPCRTFKCAWLDRPEEYADDLRPDLIGAIILHNRPWEDFDTLRIAPTGDTVAPEVLERLRLHALQKEVPLLWVDRLKEGDKYVGVHNKALGSEEFSEAVRWSVDPQDAWHFSAPDLSVRMTKNWNK